MSDCEIKVTYMGENPDLKLPGFDDLDPVYTFEVDDDIVLDGSNAETGVRVNHPNGTLDCEVFMPPPGKEHWIEIYPLDGKDQPILVDYEVGSLSIYDEDVLKGVVRLAFVQIGKTKEFVSAS